MRTKKVIPVIIAVFLIAAAIVSVSLLTSHASKGEFKPTESNVKDTQILSAENQTDAGIKEPSETVSEVGTETIEKIDLMEMADMMVYTYEELKERADAIVKVKIKDELTKENSVYKEAEPNVYNRDTGWCYSLREVEVLEVYQGAEDWNVGDTKKIQDACAIIPDGNRWVLYIFDEYGPPEKDATYLLFLEKGTRSGEPGIINYGNGSVNLDSPEKNQYPDIEKAAIEEFIN